jgi:hypothetical protein
LGHGHKQVNTNAHDDDGSDVNSARSDLDALGYDGAEDSEEGGVPRHEAVDQSTGEGCDEDTNEADETEETNREATWEWSGGNKEREERGGRGEEVGWPAEEEGERNPKGGEACSAQEQDEARLEENRLGESEPSHGLQNGEVGQVRILRGVVRDEEIECNENGKLNTHGGVVDCTDGSIIRDDAPDNAGVEDARVQSGKHDRDCGGSAFGRDEVRGKRNEDLWNNREGANEEAEDLEGNQVFGKAEADG